MITVTKKQASVALVVVAFATIMIAGSIAPIMNNAFAWGNHFGHFGPFGFFDGPGKRSHVFHSINQGCVQPSSSSIFSNGLGGGLGGGHDNGHDNGHSSGSPLSGNNVQTCANINLGGNAASVDQSFR